MPFIKNVINQGGGGLPKDDLTSLAYLVKVMTKGGWGVKNLKKMITSLMNGSYDILFLLPTLN